MSYSYYDREESKVKLMSGLAFMGWSIYGFREDQSDMMSDYFHPASWDGIAVKNGYILVVDNCTGGSIGGDFIKESYDHKLYKRVEKLRTLAECPSASQGERDNALAMIEKLAPLLTTTETIKGDLPAVAYQANPGNAKWHIEHDGEIIAKGTGIYNFGHMQTHAERYIYLKDIEYNTYEFRSHYCDDAWQEYVGRKLEERTRLSKCNDKYFKLLQKWDRAAALKLGEGEEEKLVKKTSIKKVSHYVAKISETPTDYIKLSPKWRRYGGLEGGFLYKLDKEEKKVRKLTPVWHTFEGDFEVMGEPNDPIVLGKSRRTYKPEPRKNVITKYFHGKPEDFDNGNILYVELVEVIENFKESKYVKEKSDKRASSACNVA